MGPRMGPCSARGTAALAALAFATALLAAPAARAQLPGPRANPTHVTFPDNARFVDPGYVQFEGGYNASLIEGPAPALHTIGVLGSVGIVDLLEARLRLIALAAAGDDVGVGDLGVGVKGGFFGGWDEQVALAFLAELLFPTGSQSFGLGDGIGLFGGLVATWQWRVLSFDAQVAVETHLFTDDPTLFLPLSLAVTWSVTDEVRVYGDFLETLDLSNLSDSSTSFFAGAGYFLMENLAFDAGVRLGLSPSIPDFVISVGVTGMIGPYW